MLEKARGRKGETTTYTHTANVKEDHFWPGFGHPSGKPTEYVALTRDISEGCKGGFQNIMFEEPWVLHLSHPSRVG